MSELKMLARSYDGFIDACLKIQTQKGNEVSIAFDSPSPDPNDTNLSRYQLVVFSPDGEELLKLNYPTFEQVIEVYKKY